MIRAGLDAVAGHVHATRAELRVSADGDLITAEIIDDGTGSGASPAIDGLGSFLSRAADRSATPPGGGTHLTWTTRVPTDR